MPVRLVKVAKELNVGLGTLVDFLASKGFVVKNNPTTLISDEMHAVLLKEFKRSMAVKEKADQNIIGTNPSQETKFSIPELTELDSSLAINGKSKLKVLGKIELNVANTIAKEKINKVKTSKSKILNLGNSNLKEWPKELFELTWLETLIMGDNTYWGNDKEMFFESKNLSFDDRNYLTDIPQEISKLKNLKHFSIGGDFSKKYPIKSLGGLTEIKTLEVLDVSFCEFSVLDVFEAFPNLKTLDLSVNRIRTIDYYFLNIPLRVLILNDNIINDISDLAKFNKLIDGLTRINIRNNNFREEWLDQETLEIIGDNIQLIKDRLQQFLEGNLSKSAALPVKLVLLGNSQVGKTTLSKRLLGNRGKDIPTGSTHGLKIYTWDMGTQFNNQSVFIYDFGGQDYYHSVYNMFLTWQTIYILVWDYSENINYLDDNISASSGDIQDTFMKFSPRYWLGNINYWLERKGNEVQTESKNGLIKIISLQNVREKGDETVLDIIPNSHQEHYSLNLLDESAKSAELKIELLKHNIIQFAEEFDRNTLFSENDKGILDRVLKDFQNVIYKSLTIEDFCIVYGNPDNISFFLELLNSKGIIIYRPDIPSLNNSIWINPSKVSDKIYEILSKKEILNIGKILKNDFEQKVGDAVLLQLMQLQEIVFLDTDHKDNEKSKYVIPQFLPYTTDDDPLYELASLGMEDNFHIKFKDYLPHGLIARLICRMGKYPGKKYYFRNSILFMMNFEGSMVKVEICLDLEKLELVVKYVLKNDNHQINTKITNYLFKCILAAYWNEPHFEYGQELTSEGNEYVSPSSHQVWQDEYLYNYADIDMDLSLDGIHFVDYRKTLQYANHLDNNNPIPNEIFAYYHDMIEDDEGVKFVWKEKLIPSPNFNPFIFGKVKPIKKVFISYAHADMDYRKTLVEYLTNLVRDKKIIIWHDDGIEPGDVWDEKIKRNLEESDIVIMLISQKYITSTYIYENEMPIALNKLIRKNGQIIPILLEDCDYENWSILPSGSISGQISLGSIQAIPKDDYNKLKPISRWVYKEMAWMQVLEKIRSISTS